MKERPILFQGAMVRALLDGTKTQTRRIVKGLTSKMWIEESDKGGFNVCYDGEPCCGTGVWEVPEHSYPITCPYGKPGDRLWVRESHWYFKDEYDHETGYFPPPLRLDDFEYRADGESDRHGWYPSIHMPRIGSRITLEITGVRVEQLQDISESGAIAEGIERDVQPGDSSPLWRNYQTGGTTISPVYSYETLWESINGAGSWALNPWVWVVEFKVVKP